MVPFPTLWVRICVRRGNALQGGIQRLQVYLDDPKRQQDENLFWAEWPCGSLRQIPVNYERYDPLERTP
jgi:hypothetical protein